jgi:hypothetical protein
MCCRNCGVRNLTFMWPFIVNVFFKVQDVPLASEPGISLIILTPMKIFKRNLNRSTFVVWEMKRNVSVTCVCSAPNCCDTEQRSASQPGSVASGTSYITIKMQHYTIFFITVNALHVSGRFSAQHQELKTVHTESGICQACLLLPLAVAASKFDIYQILCVQFSAPDDGRRNRLKHVELWQ